VAGKKAHSFSAWNEANDETTLHVMSGKKLVHEARRFAGRTNQKQKFVSGS